MGDKISFVNTDRKAVESVLLKVGKVRLQESCRMNEDFPTVLIISK